MLAEDVCGIRHTFDMVECKDTGSNGFPDAVERQIIVSLVDFGIWDGRAVHNRLVISKHIGFLPNGNTKIP